MKSPPKTTAKTTAATVERPRPDQVTQPHGGALNTGGTPGNRGGPGRPSSAIRERLRGMFEDRLEVLGTFMDGTVRVPLQQACEHCGELPTREMTPADVLQIMATGGDRLRAFDLAAKYGMGTIREMSVDDVRERLTDTVNVLAELLPRELFEEAVGKIKPLWLK